jgi:citronellol/citronellal dehydrogenase
MRAGGGGSIINVSSVAALYPHPSLLAYGISKIGLERLTVDAARQLAGSNIAVNCFRIDIAVASEGFVANTPVPTTPTGSPPRWRPRASCG